MKIWIECKGQIHRVSYKEDSEVTIKIYNDEKITTTGLSDKDAVTIENREDLMKELMDILE